MEISKRPIAVIWSKPYHNTYKITARKLWVKGINDFHPGEDGQTPQLADVVSMIIIPINRYYGRFDLENIIILK
jgi:hypothetical protein